MNVEKKLSMLFDFQKFEGNEALSELIDSDYGEMLELRDEELSMVAAGINVSNNKKKNFDD